MDSLLGSVIQTDVATLSGLEAHRSFLENVFQVDQGVRSKVAEIELKNGRKSVEYDSVIVEWIATDRFLFTTMLKYLEAHPHPIAIMGEVACMTPILIFHHAGNASSLNEDFRIIKLRYMERFHRAYENGDLDGESYWFYLFRLYAQVSGDGFEPTGDGGEGVQIEVMHSFLMNQTLD